MAGEEAVGADRPAKAPGGSPLEQDVVFHTAFMQLQAEVHGACAQSPEWPAKIAAGIRAGLDFAIDNPTASLTLTTEDGALRTGPEGSPHPELIRYFARALGEAVPPGERLGSATDEALISTIVTVAAVNMRCGTPERLREAAPDLVQLTLLPLAGFAEAQRCARLSGRPG